MKLKILRTKQGEIYSFWCPCCEETHSFDVRPGEWKFNGNLELPSFSPSLRYEDCHLFVTDGIIEYCGDCNHGYSNRNLPMVDFEAAHKNPTAFCEICGSDANLEDWLVTGPRMRFTFCTECALNREEECRDKILSERPMWIHKRVRGTKDSYFSQNFYDFQKKY